MSEFWGYMAPFLIVAGLLPVVIVLNLWLIPSDEWAERVIRDWADSEDLRVATIDEARRFVLFSNNLRKVYSVRVQDKKGLKRECKAVVVRFLLRPTYRNIAITWIKAR